MSILGYTRSDGRVGIRNLVLILAIARGPHFVAAKICEQVRGTTYFVAGDEDGRDSDDRLTIARVHTGLGGNPNVGAVIIVCNSRTTGYPELRADVLASEIRKTGKPVEILDLEKCDGGLYGALGQGVRVARQLVVQISRQRRTSSDFGALTIGVKCGLSDATSGLAGNPVVGYAVDRLLDSGGTAFFSETTEVIGAEHILARRCRDDTVRRAFLDAVAETEEAAKATGEDIRTINPIPANIEAGITTLEEKSLGAVAKSGHHSIQGVLRYAERPASTGLFFVDSWMSSSSLFLGYAASGAQLIIFQLGGGALHVDAALPSTSTGLVAPIFYATGNPRTSRNLRDEIDFDSGSIIEHGALLAEVGEQLVGTLSDVASGTFTKAEALLYQDPVDVYLKGPQL